MEVTSLSLKKLPRLFDEGRQLIYQKDDIVIRPGDFPSGVYYIVSGWIKAYCLSKDGEPNIIMTMCPGEAFPLAWAISGSNRDVGFAALGDSELRRISLDHFVSAMDGDSSVAKDVLQALADQVFLLTTELDNLQYRSAREKVAFRLICLANRMGQHNGQDLIISARVTNDYIARSTNMTRETASRELSRLHRRKLIRNANGRIAIPDIALLRNEISRRFNIKTLSLD